MLDWQDYARILGALLIITDPVSILPTFIALTADRTPAQRKRAARVAACGTAVILGAAAILGDAIIRGFGASVAAFEVGAGLILLIMAIELLQARLGATRQVPGEVEDAEARDEVALVPVAVPLLAGPGAISTVMVYAHRGPVLWHGLALCGIIVVVALVVWVVLRSATTIARLLGRTGINIANRLLGLILSGVAVGLMADGVKGLFPSLR